MTYFSFFFIFFRLIYYPPVKSATADYLFNNKAITFVIITVLPLNCGRFNLLSLCLCFPVIWAVWFEHETTFFGPMWDKLNMDIFRS